MLKKLSVIAVAGSLFIAQSCALAYETQPSVDAGSTKHAVVDITKGNGFDVYNKTPYELQFKLNGTPFGGISPPGSYGTLTASWTLIKFGCVLKEVCPVEIIWKTPGKDTIINTTINTKTGVIGRDTSLDANLPSLNGDMTKANIPLIASLSNENGAVSGHGGRNGYELVTVTPK